MMLVLSPRHASPIDIGGGGWLVKALLELFTCTLASRSIAVEGLGGCVTTPLPIGEKFVARLDKREVFCHEGVLRWPYFKHVGQ